MVVEETADFQATSRGAPPTPGFPSKLVGGNSKLPYKSFPFRLLWPTGIREMLQCYNFLWMWLPACSARGSGLSFFPGWEEEAQGAKQRSPGVTVSSGLRRRGQRWVEGGGWRAEMGGLSMVPPCWQDGASHIGRPEWPLIKGRLSIDSNCFFCKIIFVAICMFFYFQLLIVREASL